MRISRGRDDKHNQSIITIEIPDYDMKRIKMSSGDWAEYHSFINSDYISDILLGIQLLSKRLEDR